MQGVAVQLYRQAVFVLRQKGGGRKEEDEAYEMETFQEGQK